MKKLIALIAILVCLTSCEPMNDPENLKSKVDLKEDITKIADEPLYDVFLMKYDSSEYLIVRTGSGVSIIKHK